MNAKKFVVCAFLLGLITFLIPVEYKYDKLFRFFSLKLIPQGAELPPFFEKRIFFYLSDIFSALLLGLSLFWLKIPFRSFFTKNGASFLWFILLSALISIIASPFSNYPLPYIRLLQLLTPITLFSLLANNQFTDLQREKMSRWILVCFISAALFQTTVAICQYFFQHPLGLRLLSESNCSSFIDVEGGKRWLFDSLFPHAATKNQIIRACGTLPHCNVLGGFLALSIIATYSFILNGKRWMAATLFPQLFALCTTYSRSAIFGWAIGSAIWYGLLYRTASKKFLSWALLSSVFLCAILFHEQYTARGGIINYNNAVKSSDSIRCLHQNTAIEMIKHKPLTGVGFAQYTLHSAPFLENTADSYIRQTATHNIYLYLGAETGLFSLIAFLLFIASLIKTGLKAPITPVKASLLSIFIAFLFIGACDFYPLIFQQGRLMFFCIAGLIAAQAVPVVKETPSKQNVWKMFDAISPTYDKINRILSLGMDQRWRSAVARYLPKTKNLKLLDLATGTGDQILALLHRMNACDSFVGIDLSPEMLSIAKTKLSNYPNVQFVHADAEKLPFEPLHFDAATFSFGIRNVLNPLNSLKEIHRVLIPKGRCFILEFSLPARPIRPFYLFYLRHVLPYIGGLLSKKPSAYRYLNQTIESFPSGKSFCSLMQQAGFEKVELHRMALGGVTLYIGEKG